MTLEKRISRIFNLDGDNWLKHANPWSVWTRFATLPLLIVAIWSRVWLGWYSLIPIALIVLWLVINPTLFRKPSNFDNWAAQCVLGERLWTERQARPVPGHHAPMIRILTALQVIGGILLLVGLWRYDVWLTLLGTVIVYFAKMWFLDRMVWIYREMNE